MKLLTLLLISITAFAQTPAPTPKSHNVWLASIGVLVAANAVDTYTMWKYGNQPGAISLNPYLRDQNGNYELGKGIALKAVIIGTELTFQFVMHHRHGHKEDPSNAIGNFVSGGVLGIVAGHNASINAELAQPATPVAHSRQVK
jgi:hypothetical protein